MLPGDKSRSARGATLLAVIIGKYRAFFGYSVNIGGFVAHDAAAVITDIGNADIIAPNDQDIGLIGCGE